MELQLPLPVFTRLQAYLGSGWTHGADELTDHWAFYGGQNVISIAEGGRVRFNAGAGFDDFFGLNFPVTNVQDRLRQVWKTWRGRYVQRSFTRAFDAAQPDGALHLQRVGEILGSPLTPHKILAAHYANLIRAHVLPPRGSQYLEIGAGTGYLAALMRAIDGFRVIIVDLPEIIPFSYLYLTRLFPAAEVRLPHEMRSPDEFPAGADLVFLTPDQICMIPERSVDLAANTASFGEMLPSQIARYFHLLRRTLAREGLFFTANRVEKRMSPSGTKAGGDAAKRDIAVRFDEYPWHPHDQDIFFGPSHFHTVVQPDNPVLQRLCRLAPA